MRTWSFIDRIETYLTYTLVLSFLLNINKTLVPSVLGGEYSEYLDISVYLFDLVFIPWFLTILRHIKLNKSSIRGMFHVEHHYIGIVFQLILLVIVSCIHSFSSDLYLRNCITLLEIIALILYMMYRMFHVEHIREKYVPRGTYWTGLRSLIINFALFNVFLLVIQIFLQHSLGLYWLGESFLAKGISGVATINFLGEKILRGYGLFLHPNIAAALFLLALLFSFSNKNVPRLSAAKVDGTIQDKKCSTWNIINKVFQKMFHVEHLKEILLLLGVVLTFSRTGIIIAICLYLINVPRGTIYEKITKKCSTITATGRLLWKKYFQKMFHVEHLVVFLLTTLVLLGIIVSSKSLSERELSLYEYSQIANFSFFGHGMGSYPLDLYSSLSTHNEWVIQPVHNVFLLIYYELGLVGIFILISVIFSFIMFHVEHTEQKNMSSYLKIGTAKKVKNKKCSTWNNWHRKTSFGVILFLLVFSLSDHFFFTIPQGQIIFWLALLLNLHYQIIDKNNKLFHNI